MMKYCNVFINLQENIIHYVDYQLRCAVCYRFVSFISFCKKRCNTITVVKYLHYVRNEENVILDRLTNR